MQTPLLTPSVAATVPEYPISAYNSMVSLHNSLVPEQASLAQLLHCRPYMHIWRALSSPVGMLLLLVLNFIPFLNLFLFGMLTFCLCFVQWQYQTHIANCKLVADPFRQFFLEDDLCRKLDKHFITLKLTLTELEGFTFNRQINQDMLSRAVDNRVQFTIYDDYAHNSYFEFPRERVRLLWAVLVCAALTCFGTYLELQLFILD